MRRDFHTTLRSVTIAFLVGAYLSTWTLSLVQMFMLPPVGSGPATLSAAHRPQGEKPAVILTQRRHVPPVKSIVVEAPPPAACDYPRTLAWVSAAPTPGDDFPANSPFLATHQGRAPPLS